MNKDLFRRGIDEFNREYYFECHDTLEDLLTETKGRDRLFLQGLIQITSGFYYFFNTDYKQSSDRFNKGLTNLQKYRPSYCGIELEKFMKDVVRWLAIAERGKIGEVPDIDTTKIPKLQFKNRYIMKEI